MANTIIVRIQSAQHGTKRLQVKPTERIQDFLDKLQKELNLPASGWAVYQERNKKGKIASSRTKTLSNYKIRHGDMLYLDAPGVEVEEEMESGGAPQPGTSSGSSSRDTSNIAASSSSLPVISRKPSVVVVEDEVDQLLDKDDGLIHRSRNEQLCRHGPKGKCLHCVPLEPWDEQHLQSLDPPIKFLSFHSYIRKMRGGVDKGKFAQLENISCKIKPGCKEHPPWPGGICTKCQPNAVTLNRQTYRHVDYIQFENGNLVNRFLNYWRNTGCQRIGIMFGKYEPYNEVPLGIKATVAAIYEPPQVSSKNSVELQVDENEEKVHQLAEKLGLRPVGWIFTDLIAEDLTKGTVKHFRGNINSHFLSSEECIMSADFQNKFPNPCKLSPEGHFGSKFVTVVVTGDDKEQIHFEGYQVSNQCMALVLDDCLIPTRDAPELGYIKESSNEQYVPDVFYKEMDEYGNEITKLARPLPVEYLLLDLPAAFPVEPIFTFYAEDIQKPFPIEHRAEIGETQDFNSFSSYMQQFGRESFLNAVSDFHVLLHMSTCDMMPLRDKISPLLEAVKTKDEGLAHHWSKTEEWGTVEQLMAANVPSPPPSRPGSTYVGPGASPLPPIGAGAAALWSCAHCTFANSSDRSVCDMCSLPK